MEVCKESVICLKSAPATSSRSSSQEDLVAEKTSPVKDSQELPESNPVAFRQRGSTMPTSMYRGRVHHGSGKGSGVQQAGQTPGNASSSRTEREFELDGTEYYRVRSYSVTGKVVTKCGESLRLRFQQQQSTCSVSSCTSTGSTCGSSSSSIFRLRSWSHGSTSSDWSTSGNSEGTSSTISFHQVAVLGASEVGKASLIAHFVTCDWDASSLQTSEYKENNADGDQSVSVLLDGDESEIQFTTLNSAGDISPEEFVFHHDMDAYIIVYSISDRTSFKTALHLLAMLQAAELLSEKGVILVGNKIDLERSRAVSTEEGREAATSYGCKFIETSEWMNHKVDELLVGVLSQIRLKQRQRCIQRSDSKRDTSSSATEKKAGRRRCRSRSVVRDLLRKFSISSKSCDNLHVL